MGLGAGEAEKKAKELVEKMVRWKFGKNTKLDCSVTMSISRALTRLWNGNAKYGIFRINLRRTNLTASEVTKLLNIYSTTMVSLLLTFPTQIVLFVLHESFYSYFFQWEILKPFYRTWILWTISKLLCQLEEEQVCGKDGPEDLPAVHRGQLQDHWEHHLGQVRHSVRMRLGFCPAEPRNWKWPNGVHMC